MIILVLTFLFLSWIINSPVIGWSWLKKLTHWVYPFNIAWCIVEINIYTESESRGFYFGCLSVTCHILRTSAGFMKINNRKESVQKRGNCPIFPAFTLSLYCGGDIRGGHQLPPHWWPCWVGDISHWMITEGETKKTAVEVRVTNWKNLEIPPQKVENLDGDRLKIHISTASFDTKTKGGLPDSNIYLFTFSGNTSVRPICSWQPVAPVSEFVQIVRKSLGLLRSHSCVNMIC